MKPLAERLSSKQKRTALVALIASSILYVIFYPPDIPRPNTITFEGYAPPEAGILSATASAKAERDNHFCKRHFLGARSRPRDLDERQFVKPGPNGYYKIVLNINNIPLGGLCRYRLYVARLGYNASPPTPEDSSYSPGGFAASISIPPRSGATWTRHANDPLAHMNKGTSLPLTSCCEFSRGTFPDCQVISRTIKSFDKDYTFRIDLKLDPAGCPPFVDEEGIEL